VDHIRPWRDHPELRYAEENLQILCAACHEYKTDVENQYREREPRKPLAPVVTTQEAEQFRTELERQKAIWHEFVGIKVPRSGRYKFHRIAFCKHCGAKAGRKTEQECPMRQEKTQ